MDDDWKPIAVVLGVGALAGGVWAFIEISERFDRVLMLFLIIGVLWGALTGVGVVGMILLAIANWDVILRYVLIGTAVIFGISALVWFLFLVVNV